MYQPMKTRIVAVSNAISDFRRVQHCEHERSESLDILNACLSVLLTDQDFVSFYNHPHPLFNDVSQLSSAVRREILLKQRIEQLASTIDMFDVSFSTTHLFSGTDELMMFDAVVSLDEQKKSYNVMKSTTDVKAAWLNNTINRFL